MTQTQNLVLGPPGCGKTTFLLNKVQEAMTSGTHPSRIAYVSFTKKAANEAITRAMEKFSAPKTDFPFFRTLHSLSYQQLGLTRERVMGAAHYKTIGTALGLVFSDYYDFEEGVPRGRETGDQVLYIAGMARATLRTPEEQFKAYLAGEVGWFQVKQFCDTLDAYKRETGMVDFSDMLDMFVKECEPLDIDIAFIDEAQDLSKQQWRMVRHAVSRAKEVYVGGDDDQSIYRWSGADLHAFLNLPGEQTVLAQSYRLPVKVFELCNRISSRIKHRFAKTWHPREEQGAIHYVDALNQIEWQDGSYLLLARNRFLLGRLEGMMRTNGIPYTVNGRSVVDVGAVHAIQTWEYLRRGRSMSGSDVRNLYKHLRTGSGIKRGHKKLVSVADDEVLTMADLRRDHGLLREDVWHDALDMISLEEREFYLAALRRGEKITRTPRMHISTIHGVKGGEADHVVVVSDMAARTYSDYLLEPDDEHRVAYVAASRARLSLTVLLPQTTRAYEYR